MENYYGIAAIAGICALVLLMGMMKQKSGWISVFILRCVGGTVGICAVNAMLESLGISVAAGINPVNILFIRNCIHRQPPSMAICASSAMEYFSLGWVIN